MDVRLVMFKANGQRREFSLARSKILIGRATDCDLQIPIAVVSRKHCQVFLDAGELKVRDNGSSNGTFVNDQRIQETVLNPGDRLTIGPVVFTVIVDGQPHDIKPIRTVIREKGVEPVAQASAEASGTVDVEAEQEVLAAEDDSAVDLILDDDAPADGPEDPLKALEALSNKNKKK